MRGSDFRKKRRFPVDSPTGLATPNDGIMTIRVGRCTNQSETGIQVLVAEPIEVDTFVEFQVREPKIHGCGTVRYCRRTVDGWAIGILVGDFRESARRPTDSVASLTIPDRHGVESIKVVQCLNWSENGTQVLIAEPIEVDTFVKLQVREPKINETGKVRYCRQTANGYAVGLRFAA